MDDYTLVFFLGSAWRIFWNFYCKQTNL